MSYRRNRKLGMIGRSVWFWEPDREHSDRSWTGTNTQYTNRWFWIGALEVCWLSRQYLKEEGL